MKNLTSHKIHAMLLMGGVTAVIGMTMMTPQIARADEARNYKVGAAALGVLAGVLALKGKTGPAVVAGVGAYYAYNKGADLQNEDCYDGGYSSYHNYSYNNHYDGRRFDHRDDNGYGRNHR